MLGVTTLYTLEVPDILGPAIRIPINDISSLAENLILLRFIELRAQLYRLISILKVRDSDFDPSLHEFTIGADGLAIHATRAERGGDHVELCTSRRGQSRLRTPTASKRRGG